MIVSYLSRIWFLWDARSRSQGPRNQLASRIRPTREAITPKISLTMQIDALAAPYAGRAYANRKDVSIRNVACPASR